MKIKMLIEVEVDDTIGSNDDEERLWVENELLIGDGSLILHSNEIGDSIGIVKSVKNIQWII